MLWNTNVMIIRIFKRIFKSCLEKKRELRRKHGDSQGTLLWSLGRLIHMRTQGLWSISTWIVTVVSGGYSLAIPDVGGSASGRSKIRCHLLCWPPQFIAKLELGLEILISSWNAGTQIEWQGTHVTFLCCILSSSIMASWPAKSWWF